MIVVPGSIPKIIFSVLVSIPIGIPAEVYPEHFDFAQYELGRKTGISILAK